MSGEIQIDLNLWTSFVATVALLTFTPGPSVLLTVANSIAYGVTRSVATILGDLSANALQIVLASLGLAAFVRSSPQGFLALKWIGVGYLVFIGSRKLVRSPQVNAFRITDQDKSFFNLYTQGFFTSAINPKAIIFFAAIFSFFLNESLPLTPQILILAITFLAIDGISLLAYSVFAFRIKTILNKSLMNFQGKIVGLLLILCALLLSYVRIN